MAISAHASIWNAGGGFWSAASNWAEGLVPPSSNETELFFSSSLSGFAASNDLVTAPFLLNGLTLESIGEPAAIINGNGLRFAGAGAGITQNQSGNFAIGMDLVIDVPTILGGNGSGVVTLNGTIVGPAAIIKTGVSTYEFGSAFASSPSQNTFHGGIIIENGTLRFANAVATGRTALRANRIDFESSGAALRSSSELRSGELRGPAGTIATVDDKVTLQGQNIILYTYGDAEFGGSLSTLPSLGGVLSGTLSIRGCAEQTLSGSVAVNEAITIAHGAGLQLGGKVTLNEQLSAVFNINGGALTLNNLAENNNDRIRDSRSENAGIDSVGGGTFSLIGNAAGTLETTGQVELGSRTEARSGALTVNVTHTAGVSAATVLELFDLSRYGKESPRTTINFTAQDGAGKLLVLGRAKNNPRILFSTPLILTNGLLASNDSGELDESVSPPVPNGFGDHVGWATVNGSSFATYGANGIAPIVTGGFPSNSEGNLNALLSSDGTIRGDSRFSLNSLKFAPASRGRRLTIAGKGNLRTNAILLAGENDFSIINKAGAAAGELGGLIGRGGSRYIYVQSAVLTLGVNLGAKMGVLLDDMDPVTKAGAGTLALDNADNHYLLKSLTINEGTVRATPGTSLPGGRIDLRGGVLEISGGGPLDMELGSDPGTINWRGNQKLATETKKGESPKDKGSGGFSAFGADATVTISSKTGTDLFWEEPYFVDSNNALIFGSTRADHCITFASSITLLGGPGAKTTNFNAREFCVIDNPNSTRDFARISGSIKGPVYTDLMKTGSGILELTGDNGAFHGGLVIAEGSLLANNSRGFGSDSGAYVLLGMRSGQASSALLASHHSGVVNIARDISVQSGSVGDAILGNTTISTMAEAAPTAGDAIFSGRIFLGLTGCGVDRTLRLHAEPNTNVTFSGGIAPVEGYLGTMNIELSGEGVVLLAGKNSYAGTTFINHGSLQLASANALSSTSRIALASNAALILNGFNQEAGSLEGAGSVDLGAATLAIGSDDSTTLFGGLVLGSGGLVKTGSGRFMLTGANTYSGGTIVENGVLAIENAIGSATGSGPVVINQSAVLEGTGVISGALSVAAGGILSPGDGVGKFTTGSAAYKEGAVYRWDVKDAAGRGGAGVDCHQISGSLIITATSANPFVINIKGIGRNGEAGQVAHFSSSMDYAWVIATATGGITGFDPAVFQIQKENFVGQNPIGNGSFSVARRGNNLVLLFTGSPAGGAGIYNGLITNSLPSNASSGYFRITSTKSGLFSGSFKFAGYNYILRGKFDQAGTYSATGLKSPGGATLSITLHLDIPYNRITGTVGEGESGSMIVANRKTSQSSLAPEAGAYTVLLPPDSVNIGPDFPQGCGYAIMRVSTAGVIAMSGKLGDGTPFSMGTLLDNDGAFPFYVALYTKGLFPRGSIRGSVQFEDKQGVSDFDGLLDWEKPPRSSDDFYPKGFITRTHLIGSQYDKSESAVRVLNLPDGNAQFSLPDRLPIHIFITPKNTVTVTDSPNEFFLKLNLEKKTGLFSGSFLIEPQTRTAFEGVLFQKQRLGAGLFLKTGQSSIVSFGPP